MLEKLIVCTKTSLMMGNCVFWQKKPLGIHMSKKVKKFEHRLKINAAYEKELVKMGTNFRGILKY